MSNNLNILINKITEAQLACFYKKHYKNYDTYYLSDEYKLDIDYIINEFKNDILAGFNIAMEQEIDMEDEEDIREQLTIWNDNFDNTFEYISQCYNQNIYYPNTFNNNWIIDLFELKNNSNILK